MSSLKWFVCRERERERESTCHIALIAGNAAVINAQLRTLMLYNWSISSVCSKSESVMQLNAINKLIVLPYDCMTCIQITATLPVSYYVLHVLFVLCIFLHCVCLISK